MSWPKVVPKKMIMDMKSLWQVQTQRWDGFHHFGRSCHFRIDNEWSQGQGECPGPCPALPNCRLTDSLCFTLHTDHRAVPHRGSCPGHSQDGRHLKRGWKRTGGTEERLRNSPSQAGMPSLAYRPVFLWFPKGFLCIHVSYPSSCPTLPSCSR